ncbi:MAG: hypothetical protein K1X75_11930 [Leptospirales bacterium]|nr:hypothetical protein [Leptospirales bacterium]
MSKIARLLFFVLLSITVLGELAAQTGPEPGATPPGSQQAGEKPAEQKPAEAGGGVPTPGGNRRRELHRIWLQLGLGRAAIRAGILNETPNAWLLNSAVQTGIDSNYPFSIPILNESTPLHMLTAATSAEYAYADRFFVGLQWRWVDYTTPRESASRVNFLVPGNTALQPSIYEGLRLVRYEERRSAIDFAYLYPLLTPGLKLGGFIAYERFTENNDLTLGSYTGTRSSATPPSTITASNAAVTPARYDMRGWLIGLAARYQIFDWLGVSYRLAPLYRRSGAFSMSGFQTLSQYSNSSGLTLLPIFPFAVADFKDSGVRHTLEGTIRFSCIYTFTLGVLKEDMTRTYSSYFGASLSTGGQFASKTPTFIGIGETSASFKITTLEYYMRFGVLGFL